MTFSEQRNCLIHTMLTAKVKLHPEFLVKNLTESTTSFALRIIHLS